MFKDMLGQEQKADDIPYIARLQERFRPLEGFSASYLFMIDGAAKPLYIKVSGVDLTIQYGQEENIDVLAKLSPEVMRAIVEGRMTFQRAFMTGDMSAKGNFKTLRTLDQLFPMG
jgi:putative sterol carrier protein